MNEKAISLLGIEFYYLHYPVFKMIGIETLGLMVIALLVLYPLIA